MNILERKISLKCLEVETVYENFKSNNGKENFVVKTDKKRI